MGGLLSGEPVPTPVMRRKYVPAARVCSKAAEAESGGSERVMSVPAASRSSAARSTEKRLDSAVTSGGETRRESGPPEVEKVKVSMSPVVSRRSWS